MSKISFEEIGAVTATFEAEEGVKGGQVVKLSGSGRVSACKEGEAFCGVALEPRAGYAAVQVKGFVTVNRTGGLTVGWTTLEADGAGGVQAAGDGGAAALVVSVNEDGTAVLCL